MKPEMNKEAKERRVIVKEMCIEEEQWVVMQQAAIIGEKPA